jgi:hypothetical protein
MHRMARWGWLCTVLLVYVLLGACGGEASSRPRVWIDAPLSGSQREWGTVNVMSHASCESGIVEVALLVNGEEYRRDKSPDPNATLVTMVQPWAPPAQGRYALQVVAYTTGRAASEPAIVQVIIGSPAGAPLPSPDPAMATPRPPEATGAPTTPSSEPAEPTSTPVPAEATSTVAAPSATQAPAAPTSTPRPPEIAYFEAYPSQISRGVCSELRWGVEHAEIVLLDGNGVGLHETREVCPNITTSYVIEARSAGGQRQASVTVTVMEPPTSTPVPDTSGPEILDIRESADPIYTSYPGGCDPTQVTITARVTDASGVQEVVIRYKVGGGAWEGPLVLSPAGGDRYRIALPVQSQMPTTVQYQIRATDSVGNESSVEQGTVQVIQCSTG